MVEGLEVLVTFWSAVPWHRFGTTGVDAVPQMTNGVEEEINRSFARLTSFSTDNVRTIRKRISRLLLNASGKSVHALALQLLKGSRVPRFFVYELIQHHREAFSGLNSGLVKRLGSGIQSWSDVHTKRCWRRELLEKSTTSWTLG
jgi:hypothetical protein